MARNFGQFLQLRYQSDSKPSQKDWSQDSMSKKQKPQHGRLQRDPWEIFLFCIPILCALGVWFSSLAFVPVPWPDDSAFYFVAKELFKWPPRWVMLPQAPFE